jgi:AcrR family transcriptional regulator
VIIVINNAPSPRPRGRPRAFDRDVALAKAGQLFWRLGYEGASIADLTEALGITPQSLYAAFKSKAELYREALAWYQREIGNYAVEALQRPDVFEAIESSLMGAAVEFARGDRPKGCMISTAVLACSQENAPIAETVASLRSGALAAYRARLDQAVRDGALRPDTDVGALARYFGAIIQGMSVQARDGATADELTAIARIALAELDRHRAEPASCRKARGEMPASLAKLREK